jgi:hypothetical protein
VHRSNPPLAAAAVLALGVLPGMAQAEACTSFMAMLHGPACHGAGINTAVSFRAYGDEHPAFGSAVDLLGTGDSETTSAYFPDTFSPSRSVVGFASGAIRAGITGHYRGERADVLAAASLATGGLKVAAGTSDLPPDPQDSVLNSQLGVAWLRDQITVVFPKTTDRIEVTLTMAVTGQITPSPLYAGGGVQAQFLASAGGGQIAGAGRAWSLPGAVSDTLSDTLLLLGEIDLGTHWQSTFDLQAGLFTQNVPPGSRVDFGNSAYLGIQLPEAAAFTSASGTFLSTPVPEPATAGLLALGLAVLGWRTAGRPREARQSV